MKKFYFLYILVFNLLNAQIEDFWKAKTACLQGIKFESKKKEYYAKNIKIEPKEKMEEFCTIIGTKKTLFEVEGKSKNQADMEFGYFVPLFMEKIFPQIKKFAIPPEAVVAAFPECNVNYIVKLTEPSILISSKVVVPTKEKEVKEEEIIKWEGGFFEIPWDSVLPETLKGEVIRGPIDNRKLNLLCNFPEIIMKEEEELYGWTKKTPGQTEVNELTWHKDMFTSFMEAGYFSSFYSKHIFPKIKKKYPEVPPRFTQENFLLTYITELDLTGIVLAPVAESGEENWRGARVRITWSDALPDEIKAYIK